VIFVPISGNHYDDLLARFELEPERVEQLRRLGILYDRSAAGECLHVCTGPFAERFFIELVRRQDCDGHGALNAPARMASQPQRG
jgi:4-hydroxyphenylpyruvate dioxygenase